MPSQRACAPGADDERIGGVNVAAVAFEADGLRFQVNLVDVVHDYFGADVLGLGLHLLHEPWALNGLGETGVVFDIGCDGQLSARLRTLDQQWLQHCARGVHGGRITSGAGAEDDYLGMAGLLGHKGHRVLRCGRRPDVMPAMA